MRRSEFIGPAFVIILTTCFLSGGGLYGNSEIEVLIYWCEGAAKTKDIQSSLEICNKLNLIPGYTFSITRKWFDSNDKLKAEYLALFDVLVVPGGYLHKFPRYWIRDDIRDWIREGGGYVGICGGEILAIEGYVEQSFFGRFQGLEIAPNIFRINPRWVGERNILMTETGTRLLGFSGNQRVLHWNGSILGYRDAEARNGDILAVFRGNQPDQEDPAYGTDLWNSAWEGGAAIIGDTFGKGRIILSGPHPEFPTEGGKYQKPRIIGGMIKWAVHDDAAIPFIIGRNDSISQTSLSSTLSAMSCLVTAEASISSMNIHAKTGQSPCLLAIYAENEEGRPGALLARTDRFTITEGNDLYRRVDLEREIILAKGDRIWLAWIFERPTLIFTDSGINSGDLGDSLLRISSLSWSDLESGRLPDIFPEEGTDSHLIASVYAHASPR